jgi:hypothetical protein
MSWPFLSCSVEDYSPHTGIGFLRYPQNSESVAFEKLYEVEPNPFVVLSVFEKYICAVRTSGWRFNTAFYTKKTISLRARGA